MDNLEQIGPVLLGDIHLNQGWYSLNLILRIVLFLEFNHGKFSKNEKKF